MEEDSGISSRFSSHGSVLARDDQRPATEHTHLIVGVSSTSPPPYTTSTDGEVKIDEEAKKDIVIKTYPMRWFVLLVFFLHLTSNNTVWITTSPISDITACYYGVSLWWINAMSWAAMLTYVLIFLPVARFVDVCGLRATAIIGGCANAAGCWLRFAGIGPDMFWLLLTGQMVASITNVFEWAAPSLLASVWFPLSERTTASALLGAISAQLGVLIGLVIGPFYVQNPNTDYICNSTIAVPRSSPAFLDWQGDIGSKMYYYLLGQAVFASIIAVLGFFVSDAPPTPPSISKHIEDNETKMPFITSLKLLFKNVYFVMYMVVFSITIAVSGGFVSVVDEVLNNSGYEGYQVEIGYLGIVAQVSAMFGMIVVGRWLDFTKTYYCTANALAVGGLGALIGFAVIVQFKLSFWLVCVMAGLESLTVPVFQAISYEYTVEMTYPVPEATSASVLNAFSQLVSIGMINIVVLFVTLDIGVYSNWFIAGTMLVCAIVMVFVRPKLRRVKLDSTDDSKEFSCWRVLSARRNGFRKASIQGHS